MTQSQLYHNSWICKSKPFCPKTSSPTSLACVPNLYFVSDFFGWVWKIGFNIENPFSHFLVDWCNIFFYINEDKVPDLRPQKVIEECMHNTPFAIALVFFSFIINFDAAKFQYFYFIIWYCSFNYQVLKNNNKKNYSG